MSVVSNNLTEEIMAVAYFSARIIETIVGGVLSVLVTIMFHTSQSQITPIGFGIRKLIRVGLSGVKNRAINWRRKRG